MAHSIPSSARVSRSGGGLRDACDNGSLILFRNAALIDGTGVPPSRGSLLVREGRIEAAGEAVTATECEVVDCAEQLTSLRALTESHHGLAQD